MSKKVYSIDRIENINSVDPTSKQYFVVLRNNRRVSELNHVTMHQALREKNYWDTILHRYPDGTRMSILACDNPSYRPPVQFSKKDFDLTPSLL